MIIKMAGSDGNKFEEVINDDILHVLFDYFELKEMQPMMEVNQRWRDVGYKHLMTRTRLIVDEFIGKDRLEDEKPWTDEQKTKHFEKVKRMLRSMPGLKSLGFNFERIKRKDEKDLIKTIAIHNPLIEELHLGEPGRKTLKMIIKKFGSKIKILGLYESVKQQRLITFGRAIFEGFPNLEEIMIGCFFNPEMLEYIHGRLKKISFGPYVQLLIIYYMKALIKSPHSSSIECLRFERMNPLAFDFICNNFKDLKSFEFMSEEKLNLKNLSKLKNLKKVDFAYVR